MYSFRKLWVAVVATLVFLPALVSPGAAQSIPDFSFVHVSDSHAPNNAGPAIAEIADLGRVELTPFDITADAPSFVIDTGDMMEFGPFEGALDVYLSWYKDVKVPIYRQAGNHDNTWYCVRRALRRWHGSHCYSFDRFGCHFIGLDTSTPQDPRPTITREQLLWLKEDLKKVKPETPVFLFMHHNPSGSEFASLYECDQLVDILRPYNVVLLMAGHSHGFKHADVVGLDLVTGGSSFSPTPGFSIVSVKDGVLRVAYKKLGHPAATERVFEKRLPAESGYPVINISGPEEGRTYRFGTMAVTATVSENEDPIVGAAYSVDGSESHELAFDESSYTATINADELAPGAHYIRVTFTDKAGKKLQRSTSFYTEAPDVRALWRSFVGGSVKGTPAIAGDTVYVGATDGKLYAMLKRSGRQKWAFETGGEILCEPLAANDTVYFGSGDAKFYAVGADGKSKWSFQAGGPVYSSPVLAGKLVLFGCNDSKFYALDAKSGDLAWVNEDPLYSIESKPFVNGDTVYFGAWDTFVYAVDVKTGDLKWKCVGYGSATQPAARYYSPADCGPVVADGKVFIADRHYSLSIIDASTGELTGSMEKCSAVALSEDGRAVYLRRTDGNLTKIDTQGGEIWSVPAGADFMPAAPTERDGVVYVSSRAGRVEALSAADGSHLWQFRATPGMFVMSSVEARDGVVYVSGMDGSVAAVKAK